MEKIMPLSQAEEYLDIPYPSIQWRKIIDYVESYDNTETITENCLAVIIELLKSISKTREVDEGFYFLIKNILRALSKKERQACMSTISAVEFLRMLMALRNGNVEIWENGIIEAFCFMAEKLNVVINRERINQQFMEQTIGQMIVTELLKQVEKRKISSYADGLSGCWTVLQDIEIVQQIIHKFNLVNQQNLKEN